VRTAPKFKVRPPAMAKKMFETGQFSSWNAWNNCERMKGIGLHKGDGDDHQRLQVSEAK